MSMDFLPTDPSQSQRLLREIQKNYAIQKQTPTSCRQTFFDTFDWRLFRKGLTLIVDEGQATLISLKSNTPMATAPWPQKKPPRFWWEWPEGNLKTRLRSLLEVRALLPVAKLQVKGDSYGILNKDEKTVLQARLQKLVINTEKTPVRLLCLRLEPVRGYDMELQQFGKFLTTLGMQPVATGSFEMIMKAAGKQPGDYSSKLDIKLTHEMTASEAARTILSHLLNTMRRNEAGVKDDIDTEFLHDFRVAVRRSRSALTQIKGVFRPNIVERFTADFANIGKLTNQLRDLDVFLLKETEYKMLLPEVLRQGLDGLFRKLVRARKREQKKVAEALEGQAYKQLVTAWSTFLEDTEATPLDEAPNALKPVTETACKFIIKKYRKILTLGKAITPASPDEELHRLRIECKKLRYLLEFYASLFQENEINTLMKQLKKLQDNLGVFNDLFVQTEMLFHSLGTFDSRKPESALTQSAIGALIADLYRKQTQERRAFAQTFAAFSAARNQKLFRKLFGRKKLNHE
ncbi:MAG: CHAD domain-containing protein [Caldithrix sp.]|nr:MAG: CHAD domain-containing protein [Caldithrix sp.]